MGFSGPPSVPDVRLHRIRSPRAIPRSLVLCLRSSLCRDVGASLAVTLDGDRVGAEHLDAAFVDPPSAKVAADHGVLVQSDVSFAEPADDPPEGEVIDLAEGPRGHP